MVTLGTGINQPLSTAQQDMLNTHTCYYQCSLHLHCDMWQLCTPLNICISERHFNGTHCLHCRGFPFRSHLPMLPKYAHYMKQCLPTLLYMVSTSYSCSVWVSVLSRNQPSMIKPHTALDPISNPSQPNPPRLDKSN